MRHDFRSPFYPSYRAVCAQSTASAARIAESRRPTEPMSPLYPLAVSRVRAGSGSGRDHPFELDLGSEAVAVAPDRQHRQFAPGLAVGHRAVLRRKAAVDLDPVPFRGVTDIGKLQIVLLGPEERHCVEPFARADHVAGGGLTLPLGDDPVLDADPLAGQPVGPPGDVAGGPDAGNARLEIRVDCDAAVDRYPGLLGEYRLRPHPDPDDDEVGLELFPAL